MSDPSTAEMIVQKIMALDLNAMNRWQVLDLSAGDKIINLINLNADKKTDPIFEGFGPGGWLKMDLLEPGYRLFTGLNSDNLYDLALVKAPVGRDVLLTFGLLDKAEGTCFDQLTQVIDAMTEKARAEFNL